ncbi:unnamed protein product, partial [Tenebrio molitor]
PTNYLILSVFEGTEFSPLVHTVCTGPLIPNGDYSILDTHFCRFLILVYHFVN